MSKSKSHGSGTGEQRYYRVEARATYLMNEEPREVNGFLVTREWRQLPVAPLPSGVLVAAGTITVPGNRWDAKANEMGFLPKEAAYALAVRFQVGSDGAWAGACLETRLVEVKLRYSYDTEEIGVTEPFSLFEALRYLKTVPREPALEAAGQREHAPEGGSE